MDKSKLWAIVAIVLCLVGSATGLVAVGRDVETILYLYAGIAGIASTTIPVLFQVAKLNAKQDEQTDKLNKITENTNGILDAKIRNGVRAGLQEFMEGGKQ